ncbi:hypothetical protein [Mastigocoleus testarum]|uniref:Uncharacterized protein n=1 Tax=Mastigocoleus testarum BC008 TaxID=371196 RepID=A0A0V7ZHE2_9CYAN|nr:hypothetical protein [Mastigocoleus testarum]KST64004.1 hypothetical protein BC008_40110 [Mastigocoleus testarum BC008]KST64714.1 hypothetical protein BC008_41085 [Mastigocoleus testarum BC008]
MFINRLTGVIFGALLAFNGLVANPKPTSASEDSGGNVSQSPIPQTANTGTSSFISPQSVNDIRRFINSTRNNRNIQRQRFNNRRRFSNDPSTPPRCNLRRFALGPAPSNENASSRSCSATAEIPVSPDSSELNELNTLLENSRAFLERVNQDIEGTRSRVNNRLW